MPAFTLTMLRTSKVFETATISLEAASAAAAVKLANDGDLPFEPEWDETGSETMEFEATADLVADESEIRPPPVALRHVLPATLLVE